jgi:hypothetical protein
MTVLDMQFSELHSREQAATYSLLCRMMRLMIVLLTDVNKLTWMLAAIRCTKKYHAYNVPESGPLESAKSQIGGSTTFRLWRSAFGADRSG